MAGACQTLAQADSRLRRLGDRFGLRLRCGSGRRGFGGWRWLGGGRLSELLDGLERLFRLRVTPFVRPFRLSRLLLTYLLPLIPLTVVFDGFVSILRMYKPDQLRELVDTIEGSETFDWDIGFTNVPRLPTSIIHLIGVPKLETID